MTLQKTQEVYVNIFSSELYDALLHRLTWSSGRKMTIISLLFSSFLLG